MSENNESLNIEKYLVPLFSILIGIISGGFTDLLIRGITQWLTLDVPTIITTYVTHETLQQTGNSFVPTTVMAIDLLGFTGGTVGSYLLFKKFSKYFWGEN